MTKQNYAMLKLQDMCAFGFRMGFVHTKCEPLKKVLNTLCFYQTVPNIVQEACANILNDTGNQRFHLHSSSYCMYIQYDLFNFFFKIILH